MQHNTPLRVKLENVKKLIRRGVKGPLYKVLNKLHPADTAYIIIQLNDMDRKKIWGMLHDRARLAEIILELDDSYIVELFTEMNPEKAAEVVMEMESDDVTYVLRLLPDNVKENILQHVEDHQLGEVEELLHYPEKTAGAMMNTEYVALQEEVTVKEATKFIHRAEDVEMVYYLYVVDSENRLTGVLSLRQLILNPPEKTLAEIMTNDVIYTLDNMDREDVAALVDKYDLLALPVVDEQRRMVGVITFDDVIDVIREEANEDLYRMAGASEEAFSYDDSFVKSAKARLPWLLITLGGELLSGVVIAFFQGKIVDFLVISAFMPVIMAMGGNVGTQSATIIIRNVALGKIDTKKMLPVLFREIRVGLLMGFISAIPVTFLAPLVHAGDHIGIIVGVALFAAMTFAAFTGTFVPMVLMRLRVDPAVASGPFISTLNDITGLTIYFCTAVTMLTLLG